MHPHEGCHSRSAIESSGLARRRRAERAGQRLNQPHDGSTRTRRVIFFLSLFSCSTNVMITAKSSSSSSPSLSPSANWATARAPSTHPRSTRTNGQKKKKIIFLNYFIRRNQVVDPMRGSLPTAAPSTPTSSNRPDMVNLTTLANHARRPSVDVSQQPLIAPTAPLPTPPLSTRKAR